MDNSVVDYIRSHAKLISELLLMIDVGTIKISLRHYPGTIYLNGRLAMREQSMALDAAILAGFLSLQGEVTEQGHDWLKNQLDMEWSSYADQHSLASRLT